MWKTFLAIAIGAALGAWLRWLLGLKLNTLLPHLAVGTLTANLLGAYIIGLAIAFFSSTNLSPEWKLLIITGFCGSLTTFSTFSAEVMSLFQNGRVVWAAGVISAHIAGSLLMTLAGMFTWQWFKFH
ncbi:fluoride efflux transporter CrcB [Thiothrix subterranea]|uniref:Fluoride-specific ion channel FluC n=1 Tax=Thiothrix subterranea TaxID=2735563 RepID=A0AA51MQE8_9GAMM|nr:fluoride efflux transporter CrcB [Thiothrix subterranea]MDQ5769671.1 fluoride efflux transporter CrcB [Thiothrix subterranea]WML88465.1 fluoride efflux transporter CrcB [Thiothrix subterranea]